MKTVFRFIIVNILLFLSSSCCSPNRLPEPDRDFYGEVRSFAKSYTIAKVDDREVIAALPLEGFTTLQQLADAVHYMGTNFSYVIIQRRIDQIAVKMKVENLDEARVLEAFVQGMRDYVGDGR